MKKRLSALILLITVVSMLLSSCDLLNDILGSLRGGGEDLPAPIIALDSIPEYDGTADYVEINGGVPFFENEDVSEEYELFSELDSLGRCGAAIACIGQSLMPTEEREEIGHVKPSGWHSVEYDIVPGKSLYNRCHLIGFQLTGENDNEKNLITGTRNLNNEGMLPFENSVASYIKRTGNRVLYRVTPIYKDSELVARGVLMEAKSVEDDEICFCIYVYNNQSGVVIDYRTGESRLADHPHSEVLGDGHDSIDIIPAAADGRVTHMYGEFEGDELVGVLVICSSTVQNKNMTVAADIDREGRVDSVTVLTGDSQGELSDFCLSFSDLDRASAASIALTDNEEAAKAVRDSVLMSIDAMLAYVDAVENGNVYVINISSGKFHEETCSGAISMSEANRLLYVGYAADLVRAEYQPCGTCDPE